MCRTSRLFSMFWPSLCCRRLSSGFRGPSLKTNIGRCQIPNKDLNTFIFAFFPPRENQLRPFFSHSRGALIFLPFLLWLNVKIFIYFFRYERILKVPSKYPGLRLLVCTATRNDMVTVWSLFEKTRLNILFCDQLGTHSFIEQP
jgi:hypothetical protein